MQIVEINNAKLAKIGVADIRGIIHFCDPHIIAQDAVFLIDVHCCFREAPEMDDQGGVLIYRHLLKLHERTPEKLKVIFYSPVSADGLVAISNGENYILKLMPFIECRYDGKFEEELMAFVNALDARDNRELDNGLNCKNGWPHFLCASDNLLSGWAMSVHNTNDRLLYQQIKVDKAHQILLLDDQLQFWLPIYQAIFADFDACFIFPKYVTQKAFRQAWRNNDALAEIQKKAKVATAVISDLYINEDHWNTKFFKSEKDLCEISGYLVLKSVKTEYPHLPYMMFTGSNKVWNYEVFHANGIWNWSVKHVDVVIDGLSDPRVQNFGHFESNVARILDQDWSDLRELWRKFQNLKDDFRTRWWMRNLYDKSPSNWPRRWPITNPQSTAKEKIAAAEYEAEGIMELIENSFLLLSRTFSTTKAFESDFLKDSDSAIFAQVVIVTGGIIEKLGMKLKSDEFNEIANFLFLLRGYFAHGVYSGEAKRSDAILALSCILDILLTGRKADLANVPRNQANQVMPEFVLGLNYFYYAQFQKIKPNSFNTIGEQHLSKLISEVDQTKLQNLDFQVIMHVNANGDALKIQLIRDSALRLGISLPT